MTEARVCFVPYQQVGWRPEPPSAASYAFLKQNGNVAGVRLQYLYDDPRWWDGAINAVIAGGMEVHGNFCVNDMTGVSASDIEQRAFAWATSYGHRMKSVSFGNEPGYAFPDEDIAKGGTRDCMREYADNFWLPFIRGVRQANPDITIGGPDAESADTLQRFVDLVDVDQWLVHPYGEKEISDDGGLDYATMAGENGKPGFISITKTDGSRRQLIISEIDHQQHEAAKARGALRGIATDEEIDGLNAFSLRMRDEFNAPVITFGTGEYFFTRKNPPDPWSTWTHGPQPVLSDVGRRLAAMFGPIVPPPRTGRRPGRRRES